MIGLEAAADFNGDNAFRERIFCYPPTKRTYNLMGKLKNAAKYFVIGFVIAYVVTFSILFAIPRGHDFDPPVPDKNNPFAVLAYTAEMDAREKTHPLAIAMVSLLVASLVGFGGAMWGYDKTNRA